MRNVYLVAFIAALTVGSLLMVGSLLAQGETKGVPDTQIGLSKASVFDAPAPPAILWNTSEPGDLALPPRGAPEEPPVVPHGLAEFLPILLDENQCVDCHAVEAKEPGEPTPIPPSHYEDLRRAPGAHGDAVAGARYNCVACHVSPGDNELLVENIWRK